LRGTVLDPMKRTVFLGFIHAMKIIG